MSNPYQQPGLFDHEPTQGKRHKRRRARGLERRTSPASVESFDQIKGTRNRTYRAILESLIRYDDYAQPADLPTSRELWKELKASGELSPHTEVGGVRARLSELSLDYGCVENATQIDGEGEEQIYLKRIEGEATSSVWKLTPRGRLFLDFLRRREGDK